MAEALMTFVLNLTLTCYGYLTSTKAIFWIWSNMATTAVISNIVIVSKLSSDIFMAAGSKQNL